MPIRYSSVVGGSSGSGFNLDIGTSGNTTFVLSETQPAGGYSITSQLADSTIEFYAIAEDGTLAGYTNSKALTASKDFDTLVVYGATNNDLITFEFKETTVPSGNGDQDSGAAPFVTSVSDADLANIDDTTIITGGNFATNVTVTFTGTDNVIRNAKSIVRTNSTQLIVTRPDEFLEDNSPYTITVSNPAIPDSSYGTQTTSVTAGGDPTWTTSSGNLEFATESVPYSSTLLATDPDGSAISYSIASGSLPDGLSLNSSTGEISGLPTTGGQVSNFVVTASDESSNTTNRSFSISVSELISVDYLVIAGGGGGGQDHGGGGGAGGYRSSVSGESSGGGSSAESSLQLLTYETYSLSVGQGGATNSDGEDSSIASIVANGGGSGGNLSNSASNGGSGGGGSGHQTDGAAGLGTNNQGFSGGLGDGASPGEGGGGGGAGSVGQDRQGGQVAGNGGSGIASSITGVLTSRAGGGGGGGWSRNSGYAPGSATDGGGEGAPAGTITVGLDAIPNTGGGGGGGGDGSGSGGSGGSGVVILKYPNSFSISAGSNLKYTSHNNGSYVTAIFTEGSDNVQFEPVSTPEISVQYLVIAGGGGGGNTTYDTYGGGGGGAGGYRSSVSGELSGGGTLAETPLSVSSGSSYTVTVGGGGTGGGSQATNGTNSVFGNIISNGGGRGAGWVGGHYAPESGGSGGGGSGNGIPKVGKFGSTSQGFQGGKSMNSSSPYGGGGGGGASAPGTDAQAGGPAGNGGNGISSSITGTSIARGGGGAAGQYTVPGYSLPSPGLGGGGSTSSTVGNNGQALTGGGGGGAGYNPSGHDSGNGGSGVVIIKYPNTETLSVGPGLVSSTDSSSVPGYKITTFTSGTDTITFS